jgi:hypothetical protein
MIPEENKNGWGGKRPGAGRKKLAPGKKKKLLQLYLTDDEREKVKAFVKMIRDSK